MGSTIRELLVKIGVEGDQALKDADKLDKAFDGLKGTMVAATAAVTAFVAAGAVMVKQSIDQIDKIDKQRQAAAVTAEAYQEMAFAAGQASVDADQMTKALARQLLAVDELKDGVGTGGEALMDLGIAYSDLQGMAPEKIFGVIADQMALIPDESERVRIAMDVFGARIGQKMVPLLNVGSEGLEAMAAEANRLGLVLSDEAVAAGVLFNDTMGQVWAILQNLRNEIVLRILPVLQDAVAGFREWITANRELLDQGLDRFFENVRDGIDKITTHLRWVDDLFNDAFGGWEPVIKVILGILGVLSVAMAGLAAAKLWVILAGVVKGITAGLVILGAKIVALGAIIIALGLAIEDLIVYFRGGESAIGSFLDANREGEGILGSIARGIEKVIEVGRVLFDFLSVLGGLFLDVFSITALPVLQQLGSMFLWLVDVALSGVGIYIDNVLIPLFDLLIAGMQKAMSIMSMLTGEDIVIGAAGLAQAGAGAGGGGTGFAGSLASSFAPSSSEASGGSATTNNSSTKNATIEGNQYTFNGYSDEQVRQAIAENEAERARQAAAALDGAEV